MKGLRVLISIVLAVVVIFGVICAKDIVDNGFENSRVNAVLVQRFGSDYASLNFVRASASAQTTAPVQTPVPVPTQTPALAQTPAAVPTQVPASVQTPVPVPTQVPAPVPTQIPVSAVVEISVDDFLRNAQNNKVGALNATTWSDAQNVKLTEAKKLIGKYVLFVVSDKNFSVLTDEKVFDFRQYDANCDDLSIAVCSVHANCMDNGTMKDGHKVAIKISKEFIEKLQTVACRWQNTSGEWVYGVRVCSHDVPTAGQSTGGAPAVEPTTPPVEPTTPPVKPSLPPVKPSLPPVEPPVNPEPSHSPQENPTDEPASPELNDTLDEDEGEFWETEDMPNHNPQHSPQEGSSDVPQHGPTHSETEASTIIDAPALPELPVDSVVSTETVEPDVDVGTPAHTVVVGEGEGEGEAPARPVLMLVDSAEENILVEEVSEAVELPEVETVELPEVETVELPEAETVELPEAETVELPEAETVELPEVETVELPEVETVKLPEVETVKLPELVVTPETIPVVESVVDVVTQQDLDAGEAFDEW